MTDGRTIPGLDGTTVWVCPECGIPTNGEMSLPCDCLIADRLKEAGLDAGDLSVERYRQGLRIATNGAVFFRPAAGMPHGEVSAMRLGHAEEMARARG